MSLPPSRGANVPAAPVVGPGRQVHVIIPYHNGEDVISACLRSLASAAASPVRCTVVDNSPRAGALAALAAPFPQVDILRLPGPVGFGKAANAGADRAVAAGADYLVILNQDTRLGPGAIDALISALQRHPDCGLAAPLNWALDTGEIEPGFLRSYLAFCPRLVGDALRGKCRELYEVDFVLGACLALSAGDYRRLGLFDPIYHMYKEDDDLCRRFRRASRRVGLVTSAHIEHRNSQVGRGPDARLQRTIRRSFQRYCLKDVELRGPELAGRLLRITLRDYAEGLGRAQFRHCLAMLGDDLRTIVELPRLLRARRAEAALLAAVGRIT
jgi:GT2 family glycosyltransferase